MTLAGFGGSGGFREVAHASSVPEVSKRGLFRDVEFRTGFETNRAPPHPVEVRVSESRWNCPFNERFRDAK